MLANLSIRTKQFIAIVPLAVALLFYGVTVIHDKLSTQQAMVQAEATVELAVAMGNLVHELQKERGMSAGFLSSHGKKFAARLPQQRQLVDQRLTQFEKDLQHFRQIHPDLRSIGKYARLLAELKPLREEDVRLPED